MITMMQTFWNLADVLQMPFQLDTNKKLVTSDITVTDVAVDKLNISIPMKIVSSMILDGRVIVLVTCAGNLGLMVDSRHAQGQSIIEVQLLDLAKLERPITNAVEEMKMTTAKDIFAFVEPSVVAIFSKHGKKKFKQVV